MNIRENDEGREMTPQNDALIATSTKSPYSTSPGSPSMSTRRAMQPREILTMFEESRDTNKALEKLN